MTDQSETLLRDALQAVANNTTVTSDWDRLVGDLASQQAPVPEARNRGRILMVAAALALVAGGAYALTQLDTNNEVTVTAHTGYVLPGETVLSTNPLIVAAAPGPEPEFDTSELGQELTWQPTSSVTADTKGMIDRALEITDDGTTVTKAIAMGTVRGDAFTITITDGPNTSGLLSEPTSSNQRIRFVSGPDGGSGGGDLVPAGSLDMIQMVPRSEMFDMPGAGYTAPEGWVMWDGLPSDTSIATFTDDDSKMWIRVRSGLAVFPAEFAQGETFRLVAFNALGEQLGEFSQVVNYGVDPNIELLEVGDVLEPITTIDSDGNLVELDGSGTTVLVYGGSGCPDCDAVTTDVLPILEALGGDVRVYSIAAIDGPTEAWPSENWPFTRLVPEPGSVLLGSAGYPQTVVLGGNNEVLGSFTGFEDYAQQLADAGAS